MIESFNTTPLQQVIPSYLYEQYQDDADLQAFVDSFNGLAQGYLDWFNETPLSLYTSPSINGGLLDWIGQGIYNISRPVISSITNKTKGALSTVPLNTQALNSYQQIMGGTAQIANDDIYKRVLTWHLFKGDGHQMSIPWLRRRICRFLYGSNGSDFDVGLLHNVNIEQITYYNLGSINSVALNTFGLNTRMTVSRTAAHALTIAIASSQTAQMLQSLLRQGYLSVPFQIALTVKLI